MRNLRRLVIVSTLVLIGAAVFAVPVLASPPAQRVQGYSNTATPTTVPTSAPVVIPPATPNKAVKSVTAATNAARVAAVAIAGAKACQPASSVRCQTLLKKARQLANKALALARKAKIKPNPILFSPILKTGGGGMFTVAGSAPVASGVSFSPSGKGNAAKVLELPRTGGAAR